MTTTKVNAQGFPLVECYRCGGSGRYSYNPMDGDRCYGCGGSGWVIKRGAWAKAWDAYRAAVPAKQIVAGDLRVGDTVLDDLSYRGTGQKWTTVERVEVSPRRCGSSLTGTDEANRIHYYYRIVTLANGVSKTVAENGLVRRRVTSDMLPNPADFYPKGERP